MHRLLPHVLIATGVLLIKGATPAAGGEAEDAAVWIEKDGVVVVEAETLARHKHWARMTEPEGFTGDGYVVWEGPRAPGEGDADFTGKRLQPPETHLTLHVLISNPGAYKIDVRNIHEGEDGDNDAWVDVLGRVPEKEWPVKRIGDSHKDGTEFTWADWGTRTFFLDRGVNSLFVGGRSPGFGVDRIVLYIVGDEKAEASAHNLKTPESEHTVRSKAKPGESSLGMIALGTDKFEPESSGMVPFGHGDVMLGMPSGSTPGMGGFTMAEFLGPNGKYDAWLVYLAEDDGRSKFKLQLGYNPPVEFEGSKTSSPELAAKKLGTFALTNGDPIRIWITSHEGAYARWRAFVFRPVK